MRVKFFRFLFSRLRAPQEDSVRDSRLDSLRGLALVIMMIDHLQGELRNYTYHVFGFVTAAEMFIFLSGIVTAMVYTRYHIQSPEISLVGKSARRSATLYLYHILSLGLIIALGQMSSAQADSWSAWIPHIKGSHILESPARAVGYASILVYQPTHFDILPMYAILLLIAPWAFKLTMRWGPIPLTIISSGIWMIARNGRTYKWMDQALEPLDMNPPFFDIIAWQLLFWLGFVFGHARIMGRAWLPFLIKWGWIPGLLLSIACLVIRYNDAAMEWTLQYFDPRASSFIPWLGWFRLLNFLALAIAVAGMASLLPGLFRWPWFSLLGRHSLQVYTAHIAVVFLFAPLCIWVKAKDASLWHYLLTALSLTVLTVTAILHQLWVRFRKAKRAASKPA